MKLVSTLALVLIIFAAISIGFIGVGKLMNGFNWNPLVNLLNMWPKFFIALYLIIGIAGIWVLIDWKNNSSRRKH